jgi:predicted acyl esterase
MRVVENFPRKVREIVTTFIPMSDGVKLAARIWLPEDAEKNPVPAIWSICPIASGTATARQAGTR